MHLNNWAAEYIGTEESFSERANYDSSLAVLQQELGWDGLSIRRIKVFEIQLFEIEISKVYMYNNIAPEYQCQTQARIELRQVKAWVERLKRSPRENAF